jgi:ATP-dependent RNA helicase DeaD
VPTLSAAKKKPGAVRVPKVALSPEIRDEPLPAFEELGLPEALLASVKAAGFESPTPIQARAIPALLQGKDLIGQAQTGTGKTAAFALPLLAALEPQTRATQALVLVPTRELAIQAAEQLYKLAAGTGLRVVPVYGGQPIDRQFHALRVPPAVVVGTPGRLLDHLRRGSISLANVRFCALDEADEMLAFGFIEDIETILAELPETRQTALFSATMPPRIAALVRTFLPAAVKVEIVARQRTVESIRQVCYEISPGKKREALARILDMETPGPTIVFCRTRAETQELAEALRLRGYDAEPLHGEMNQSERDRTMKKFKEGQADLLVATDVAARGLDIESVTHVVNFDLPWDVEQYIHRIGRTGRAGRTGDAITLIEPKERRNLRRFEQLLGTRIEPVRLPSAADIAARRREVFGAKVVERLESGAFEEQLATVSELASIHDLADIAAAALQLLWEATGAGASRDDALDDELAAEAERPEAGMARLFVGMGRVDKLRPADLVGAILSETGLPPKTVGAIDILDRVAFVEVPQKYAQQVIDALGGTKLRGRKPKVGYAHPR